MGMNRRRVKESFILRADYHLLLYQLILSYYNNSVTGSSPKRNGKWFDPPTPNGWVSMRRHNRQYDRCVGALHEPSFIVPEMLTEYSQRERVWIKRSASKSYRGSYIQQYIYRGRICMDASSKLQKIQTPQGPFVNLLPIKCICYTKFECLKLIKQINWSRGIYIFWIYKIVTKSSLSVCLVFWTD